MKNEQIEIYSDASNMAVMRHPGRNYPGVLVQGDTLHSIVSELQVVLAERQKLSDDAAGELEGVYERLSEMLTHYIAVLEKHGMDLPFNRRVGG